jgi:hypothetical protein
MTVKEKLAEYLVQNGLFPNEAEVIIELFRAKNPAPTLHWNDDVSQYPAVMLRPLLGYLKIEALDWIEKNCPMHFAKMMLTEE